MTDERQKDPLTQEELTGHEYDGIRELDNQLPNWWLAMFYLTILFAGGYFVYYHLAGDGTAIEREYRAEVAAVEALQAAAAAEAGGAEGPDFVKLAADPAVAEKGKKVFGTTCASCHGGAGEGGIGPNLTDRYWLHGRGGVEDIHAVVRDGVAAKGMPPWGPILAPADLAAVSVYVASLRGTNPPGGKAPQGTEIKD